MTSMTSPAPSSTHEPADELTHAATPLEMLRHRVAGSVALPGDESYAALTTPFNLAVQPRPSAVVAARTAQDVVEAVRFAAGAGMALAVQATGHGIASDLDGALLVNTSGLDECVVHPDGWARVGAGVKWHRVIDAAAPYGLAPLCGSSPDVGVVGYTTGGGLGPVARTFGLASDRVRAIEVVTGDGVLRRVTADSEPDLFWGIRGGKGALGIVTALEFDLVPLAQVYGGALYFDAPDIAAVLHAWTDWCRTLPEEATTSVALLRLPPMPGVPEPLAGKATLALRYVWTGDADAGEEAFAPMRAVATPLIDAVRVMPFAEIGSVHADPVDPMPAHEETDLLRELTSEAIDALLAVAGPETTSPQAVVELRHLGGAFAREPEVPSAFCHRDAAFTLLVVGVMAPPVADVVVPHAAAVREALAPWTTGGSLPNFAAGAGPAAMQRSYHANVLNRLTELAERFDPGHVLRVGQVPERSAR